MRGAWLNALEEVGGRLLPAARVFVDSRLPPLPGAGTSGIRWLAAQLEEFVDQDTDPADDDRFVEGAGALLGLLLIAHFGGRTREREGCHRVRLGRFGWFDPFTAIEEALAAEDPRACLSEYLSVAKREAEDDGPVSRVVRVFADLLRHERPDLDIEWQFDVTVDRSNGATVDLSRLERAARDQNDDAIADGARRIVSMLPGSQTAEGTTWNEAAERLVPRLVSQTFFSSLPGEETLYIDVVGNDVRLALQLRYGTRARYVKRTEVDSWPLEQGAARAKAIENLTARSCSMRVEPVAERIVRVRQGDGLDGARLLLPDLAERLSGLGPGTWVAAVPHRDVLLLAHTQAIEELSKLAADAVRRAPHPVSPSLFAITPQGPRPLGR